MNLFISSNMVTNDYITGDRIIGDIIYETPASTIVFSEAGRQGGRN
jgi:hypothetical protein